MHNYYGSEICITVPLLHMNGQVNEIENGRGQGEPLNCQEKEYGMYQLQE